MPSTSIKRRRSESDGLADLPLPFPLTSRPLSSRADSPALSMSSRSSRASGAKKRRRLLLQPIDVDLSTDSRQSLSTSSNVEEVIDFLDLTVPPSDILPTTLTNYKGKEKAIFIPDEEEKETANAVAGPSKPSPTAHKPSLPLPPRPSTPPPSNLLSTHTCPICFSTVTNACLTPCGHVLCGACVFASVRSSIQRAIDVGHGADESSAKCPVCRATIKGWDGRGGGIIPLKIRTITTL